MNSERLRALMRHAISLQIRAWDVHSEIEKVLGHEVENMTSTVEDFAIAVDNPNTVNDAFLDEALGRLVAAR